MEITVTKKIGDSGAESGGGVIGDRVALIRRWVLPFGFALMLAGAFNLYGYFSDKVELGNVELTENNAIGVRIEKSFSGRSTYLGFRDDKNGLYECYVGLCGYQEWRSDIGKNALIWLSGGKVVQIKVGEIVKKSPADIAETVNRVLYRGVALVLAGLVVLSWAMLKNKRSDK